MLRLLFHQAQAGAGTNVVSKLILQFHFGGQKNIRWILAAHATALLLFLSMSTSPDEILTDPGESSLGF